MSQITTAGPTPLELRALLEGKAYFVVTFIEVVQARGPVEAAAEAWKEMRGPYGTYIAEVLSPSGEKFHVDDTHGVVARDLEGLDSFVKQLGPPIDMEVNTQRGA